MTTYSCNFFFQNLYNECYNINSLKREDGKSAINSSDNRLTVVIKLIISSVQLIGPPETGQKAQVEHLEAGEDSGRRRGPCGNPLNQLDHDEEKLRPQAPPHTACPLPLAW